MIDLEKVRGELDAAFESNPADYHDALSQWVGEYGLALCDEVERLRRYEELLKENFPLAWKILTDSMEDAK